MMTSQTAILFYINPLLISLMYGVKMSHAGAVMMMCVMWMLT